MGKAKVVWQMDSKLKSKQSEVGETAKNLADFESLVRSAEDDALAGVPLPISWEAIRRKIGRCRFAYECLSLSLSGFHSIFSQYNSLVYIYIW